MFSDVQHGAVVSINEDDTEAAAATAVVLREGGLFIEPKKSREVRANHPFALLLLHGATKPPHFIRGKRLKDVKQFEDLPGPL
jgi:serine protease inhibitor